MRTQEIDKRLSLNSWPYLQVAAPFGVCPKGTRYASLGGHCGLGWKIEPSRGSDRDCAQGSGTWWCDLGMSGRWVRVNHQGAILRLLPGCRMCPTQALSLRPCKEGVTHRTKCSSPGGLTLVPQAASLGVVVDGDIEPSPRQELVTSNCLFLRPGAQRPAVEVSQG